MSRIKIHEIEMFYERIGSGPRVVLTHGAWSDGRTWQGVVEKLADRYELVSWDRRGHSRSAEGTGPGSVREDAADLAAIIEALGGDSVHLVGSSAGGTVVINLLTSRADLIRSAAVHEPGPIALAASDPHLEEVVQLERLQTDRVLSLIEAGELDLAAEYFIDELAVGPGAWEQFPDELKQTLVSNAGTVVDDLRDAWDTASIDVAALAASSVPLLISSGTRSPQMERASAAELARRIPNASFTTLVGAGHIPHRTNADDYCSMLDEFFEMASLGKE